MERGRNQSTDFAKYRGYAGLSSYLSRNSSLPRLGHTMKPMRPTPSEVAIGLHKLPTTGENQSTLKKVAGVKAKKLKSRCRLSVHLSWMHYLKNALHKPKDTCQPVFKERPFVGMNSITVLNYQSCTPQAVVPHPTPMRQPAICLKPYLRRLQPESTPAIKDFLRPWTPAHAPT